jgi:TrmH family RNA methyltransferase
MKTLTLARDLVRRKARDRSGLFVAEGVRTVEELLQSTLKLRGALTCDLLERTPRGVELPAALAARGVEVTQVPVEEFLTACDTEHPQGVLVIAETPAWSLDALPPVRRLLVLDAIQDPGNVGTLLRTAAALGVGATVALPGTVDPWNAKVVRSAVGMQFTHPTITCGVEELLTYLTEGSFALWGADAAGATLGSTALPAKLALAVGNEGAGLTPAVRDSCTGMVAVAMAPRAESLNVAVAAGILLHALRPTT